MIVADISTLPDRAKRELIRGENARAEFAIRAQTALAEAMGQMGPTRFIDGLGRKVATIHPELAARIRVKYGVRCLHDPDFLRRLISENPFLKAPCVPAKLTLRVDGLRKETNPPEDAAGTAAATGREAFQNGKRHGALATASSSDKKGETGDPAPAVTRATTRPGSSLLVPGARGSAHETPARSGKFGIRNSEFGIAESPHSALRNRHSTLV